MRSQPFSKPYRASILLVGDAELDDPAYTRWFNTAAFAAQPINTIGDAVVARNFLHGPSQRRLDLSLFKDFVLPRSARLQVRIEAYNITNAVNSRGAIAHTTTPANSIGW